MLDTNISLIDSSIQCKKTGTLGTADFSIHFFRSESTNTNDNNLIPISPWHDIPCFLQCDSLFLNNFTGSTSNGKGKSNDYTPKDQIVEEQCFSKPFVLNKLLKEEIENILISNKSNEHEDNEVTQLIVNMVVEIPKGHREKLEIRRGEFRNPIVQDYKNPNQLRYLNKPLPWNYGAIPQTWEDPSHTTGFLYKGDNDPLDIIEIGTSSLSVGSVVRVRVIGCFALLDEHELDWKLIGLRVGEVQTKEEIDKHIDDIRNWFRTYKIADNKPPNQFLFDDKMLSTKVSALVLLYCHSRWQSLIEESQRGEDLNTQSIWVPDFTNCSHLEQIPQNS